MVRQSCVDLGRSDLVEFVDSKLLKKDEKEVRILRRNNPNDQNPKDEEIKREINKLRIVKKVIRVGNVAMDILVDGYAVSKNGLHYYNLKLNLVLSLYHSLVLFRLKTEVVKMSKIFLGRRFGTFHREHPHQSTSSTNNKGSQ